MIFPGRPAKILLIDSNVYFAKRLADALKREGFEVTTSTQAAFALTTLEYDAPSAILCATNMREMDALDIARIIRADAKNSSMPIIALGDGSQRALMEAYQAGCDDYIDRKLAPGTVASHVKQIIISKADGFQPTQMLAQADTSLSGSLTHHDLPGVMQMLGHAHQTGALHINAKDADAVLFFDAGQITHAECGAFFGDEAVIHILKNCVQGGSGVYKFLYGSTSGQRTVLRTATDLMLDAMREFDESNAGLGDISEEHPSQESQQPPQDLVEAQDRTSREDSAETQDFAVAENPAPPAMHEEGNSGLGDITESIAEQFPENADSQDWSALLQQSTDNLTDHLVSEHIVERAPAHLELDDHDLANQDLANKEAQ
jgi:CheY-like chemotaxis protein